MTLCTARRNCESESRFALAEPLLQDAFSCAVHCGPEEFALLSLLSVSLGFTALLITLPFEHPRQPLSRGDPAVAVAPVPPTFDLSEIKAALARKREVGMQVKKDAPGMAAQKNVPGGTEVKPKECTACKESYIPPEHLVAKVAAGPDTKGYTRDFIYSPDGRTKPFGPVVDCSDWDLADEKRRSELLDESLATLRRSGYVVLERLLPKERVQVANDEFRRFKDSHPNGMTFSRMRARRDMTVPPFSGIWKEDWLTRHPLVLKLLAYYLRNSLNPMDEERTQQTMINWIQEGSPLECFQENGKFSHGRPMLDLMVVVDTPAGAPAQIRHRDVITPGPCASIGVHIPLTPLQLEPLNAAIGFTPGSHRIAEAAGSHAKRDIVGAVPQGSVILYDSFTEHHGLENEHSSPRCALFAWYRVPGVWSGHTDENFGAPGLKVTTQWRRYVEERLFPEVYAAKGRPCNGTELHWGFPLGREIVDWGDERVCFRCDRTGGSGAGSGDMWFCDECWSKGNPEPRPLNAAKAEYRAEDFGEQRMRDLASLGMNIKPSRGRHKLTLLRERGCFLPVDPTSEWLDKVRREPQPEGWRTAMRKALGEIPRCDGFDT
eukprot:gnl/TRDRNA2_/TRDRNA2_193217_c0_seq1.p1 gnl/TRDRNA2_/TRDRNA2_193217_c0~~gnl/TRDRNA2_/TRDRNA2_193217_c0_seq1.p1  ORF type:complete len:604 (+),score=81.00 gnl/TRDRNA2_/TRDRNA2_193217_c0_seq1:145-1956(+)